MYRRVSSRAGWSRAAAEDGRHFNNAFHLGSKMPKEDVDFQLRFWLKNIRRFLNS